MEVSVGVSLRGADMVLGFDGGIESSIPLQVE